MASTRRTRRIIRAARRFFDFVGAVAIVIGVFWLAAGLHGLIDATKENTHAIVEQGRSQAAIAARIVELKTQGDSILSSDLFRDRKPGERP